VPDILETVNLLRLKRNNSRETVSASVFRWGEERKKSPGSVTKELPQLQFTGPRKQVFPLLLPPVQADTTSLGRFVGCIQPNAMVNVQNIDYID
jgi:hypothetical protein